MGSVDPNFSGLVGRHLGNITVKSECSVYHRECVIRGQSRKKFLTFDPNFLGSRNPWGDHLGNFCRTHYTEQFLQVWSNFIHWFKKYLHVPKKSPTPNNSETKHQNFQFWFQNVRPDSTTIWQSEDKSYFELWLQQKKNEGFFGAP